MQLTLFPMVDEERKPNTRELLPFEDYDAILVSFSGGKDSLAMLLDLLSRGVPKSKIQLWHQDVDGLSEQPFMDWPCTQSYVRQIGWVLGIKVFFQWRQGGFLGELLKQDARTQPVWFERQDGRTLGTAGGLKGKISTRRRFPQQSGNMAVRWCSPALKIDVAAMAISNDPWFIGKKVLFLTGERREESSNRAKYAEKEPHRTDCKRRRVDAWRSVIDWPEARVWELIKSYRINPHPAYRLGFPRVSCATCIFGGPDQWASLRKIMPEVFYKILDLEKEFGCTIKNGLNVEQVANKGTPYPQTDDEELVALALGKRYPDEEMIVESWQMPAGAFKRGGGPT